METATAARIGAGNDYARSKEMAEKCLEGSFLPDRDTLVSFLVNALYLFGDQGIAAYGGLPGGVESELARLGHKVSHGGYLRGGRERRHGGKDRALFLAQSFGRGGDEGIMDSLRAMRKTVRPGGLLCFHIFDRDRAWNLVGERSMEDESGPAKVRLGFQPETGRITARVAKAKDRAGMGAQAATSADPGGHGASGQASVKAWNLGEIRVLLRSAGLQLERAYGDWDGGSPEAAGAATGRLIIVAARPRMARNRIVRIRAASDDGRKGTAP